MLFEWFPSRASDCLTKMLSTFRGQLQSDGYAGYEAFYSNPKNHELRNQVERAGCWAHARRKFHEAREGSPLAAQVLANVQKLCRIEAELREQKADDALRLATRQRESLPILAKIEKDLRTAAAHHLPKSLTGKAISYALDQWERLQVYTRHGHMEIDNNLVENAIRPTAVGKKNWLFFGSEEAGQTSAILYSLLESCRTLGINPQDYLLDVLPRLPTMTNQTAKRATHQRPVDGHPRSSPRRLPGVIRPAPKTRPSVPLWNWPCAEVFNRMLTNQCPPCKPSSVPLYWKLSTFPISDWLGSFSFGPAQCGSPCGPEK